MRPSADHPDPTPFVLTPDDVNTILGRDDRFYSDLSESDEREIHALAQPLLDALGPEEYLLAVARLALPHEAELRRTQPADHPTLKLLDEMRRLGRLP